MPTERITMRRVREMLKLKREGELSTQEVARRTGVARSTLREMFARFEQCGLAWPIPSEIGDRSSKSVSTASAAASTVTGGRRSRTGRCSIAS